MHRGVAGFTCITLLDDGLEVFLLTSAEHVSAQLGQRVDFAQYFDLINEKLHPKQLPLRQRLLEIHRVRNSAKHHGVSPNTTELDGYVRDARNFLDHACSQVFDVDFWSVSLIALIEQGEQKDLLSAAETAFKESRFHECLVDCRKVLFLEFEKDYDIKDPGILYWGKAPLYARESQYQENNILDPFDYIHLDSARVDADLAKLGIDNPVFWNIWRLTPAVYRNRENEPWAVKHEPQKAEEEGLSGRAAYVLENIIDIVLKTQEQSRAHRMTSLWFHYIVKLRRKNVPVYRKADEASEQIATTPDELQEVTARYSTPGLRDSKTYWKIYY